MNLLSYFKLPEERAKELLLEVKKCLHQEAITLRINPAIVLDNALKTAKTPEEREMVFFTVGALTFNLSEMSKQEKDIKENISPN